VDKRSASTFGVRAGIDGCSARDHGATCSAQPRALSTIGDRSDIGFT